MSNLVSAAGGVVRREIVIVGAGPAGIAAACAAAETFGADGGKKVLVIDNMPAPGGNIWRGSALHKKSGGALKWWERLKKSNAEIWSGATVFAAPSASVLAVETTDGVKEVEWGRLILATGARELFVPFPGWTLPNVFGCGGLQALAKGGWPVKGKRVVVAGSGPLLLAAAAQLRGQGAKVVLVAEQAPMGNLVHFGMQLPWIAPAKVFQAMGLKASLLGVSQKTSTWVTAARGSKQLEGVTVTRAGAKTWDVACDYLACSFGLVPSLELPAMLGCRVADGLIDIRETMETSAPGIYCAGEPNGIGGVETSLVEGLIAGYAAAGDTARASDFSMARTRGMQFRSALKQAFALRPELKKLATAETLVCRCEDVTRGRLEGYATWRAAKLHTRCGMGPCQGRICGGAIEYLFGWEGASVRPPVLPVAVESLGACAVREHAGA